MPLLRWAYDTAGRLVTDGSPPLHKCNGTPVTVTFNAGEKRGTAQAEFAEVLPGNATPQRVADNARITALKRAKRFALDKVLLKRCSK